MSLLKEENKDILNERPEYLPWKQRTTKKFLKENRIMITYGQTTLDYNQGSTSNVRSILKRNNHQHRFNLVRYNNLPSPWLFMGINICIDNTPVCENDKQHKERQQDFTVFSSTAPLIRHIRIWTTEGHDIASTKDTLRCISSLPWKLLHTSWDRPTHTGTIWKQNTLGRTIWPTLRIVPMK